VRVKIMIERHACAALILRTSKNLLVTRAIQTNFAYEERVPALRPKQSRGVRRETLIQQDPVHAT
jgi:hypothetical protein